MTLISGILVTGLVVSLCIIVLIYYRKRIIRVFSKNKGKNTTTKNGEKNELYEKRETNTENAEKRNREQNELYEKIENELYEQIERKANTEYAIKMLSATKSRRGTNVYGAHQRTGKSNNRITTKRSSN